MDRVFQRMAKERARPTLRGEWDPNVYCRPVPWVLWRWGVVELYQVKQVAAHASRLGVRYVRWAGSVGSRCVLCVAVSGP